jgi:hypothetical protein
MRIGDVEVNSEAWEEIGETQNSKHFFIEPDTVVSIYNEKSVDSELRAREQLNFQEVFIRSKEKEMGLIVFIDNLVSQDAASRRVYAQEPDSSLFKGVALVGGSVLSRAVASFFLGISHTAVPMRFYARFQDAYDWLEALSAK